MYFVLSLFYAFVKFAFKYASSFVAMKGFWTSLMLISFPIVLHNMLGKLIEKILTRANESISSNTGTIESITYNFTGLSAFLIDHMRIDEALSIIFSALAIRFTLSLIPFSRI